MENAIETRGLCRRFGRLTAVDDVSLAVPQGAVYGFLGRNGAGKTTTLRMLLGLIRPTAGQALIDGVDVARDRLAAARRTGALLEAHGFYGNLSGEENLDLTRRLLGLDRSEIGRVLSIVEMSDHASRRVSDYSLGMRQRLGIATALIGDPEVLILDEPANGLDPAGIRWMRDLLRGFADDGGTVLLSSHLLHEIEVIADDLVVIGRGRIVAQGSKSELLAAAGTLVRAADPGQHDRLARALHEAAVVTTAIDGGLRVDADPELVGETAHRAGVVLRELRAADGAGLEEMFLELTAETAREGAAA